MALLTTLMAARRPRKVIVEEDWAIGRWAAREGMPAEHASMLTGTAFP